MKKLAVALLFCCSAAINAQTIQMPDGKIIVCQPTISGVVACF